MDDSTTISSSRLTITGSSRAMIPQFSMDTPGSGYRGGSPQCSTTAKSPCIESPPLLHPPVNFVFVGKTQPMLDSTGTTIRPTSSPLKSPCPRALPSVTTTGHSALATTINPFENTLSVTENNFRLRPRHLMKCTSSPQSRSQGAADLSSSRGRKRRAISMTSVKPVLDDGLPEEPLHQQESATRVDAAIEWPVSCKQEASPPPPAPTQPQGYPEVEGTAMNLKSLSLKSPERPSPFRPPSGRETENTQRSLLFSSFSKFSHSSSQLVTKPAPSIATDTSVSEEALKSPALSSTTWPSPKIMPVKVLMHSQPKTPASTGRPPLASTASTSASLHNHCPVDFMGTPPSSLHQPPHLPRAFTINSPDSSLSTMHDPDDDTRGMPSSKQRRTLHADSPNSSSRKSTPSRSSRLPLPKISLTPRSDRISAFSRSEQGFFPSFPSPPRGLPTDEDYNNNLNTESQVLLQRAYDLERSIASFDRTEALSATSTTRPESFIPLPDWGEPRSRSWLSPSHNSSDQFDDMFPVDDDSISEESQAGFVLASPAVIADEKSAKAISKQKHLCRPAADSTGHLSSTSLLGINFVQSNSCLTGMDCKSYFPTHNDESQGPLGLDLENAQAVPEDRDLVTPPTLPQPKDPPRLSPRGRDSSSND